MTAQAHVLVAGASGVIGTGAVMHFGRLPGWTVTALSRRVPVVSAGCSFAHIAVDLTDPVDCSAAAAKLPAVTHLIYAAVAEAPGLVTGWYDQALIAANGRMFENILGPLAATGNLRHVSLLQGTKAYGGHHHGVEIPCREDSPRDPHPNFYWLHEDFLRAQAQDASFDFTIFRPQILLGSAPGAAMNPVAALGAYAALTRELGRPFALPGQGESVWELVDTSLLAEAFEWATVEPAAAGQVFNVTNGDVLVLAHAWPHLAAALGLDAEGIAPASLAAFFAEPETLAAWARLVARHRLLVPDLPAFLGESHHYLDLLVSPRIAARPLPMLLSTIKIRQAGFNACRDSRENLLTWLRRMAELRLLPNFAQG